MTRLNLFIITLCILCFSVLNLQAVSKINLTHEMVLTEDYDYVTTYSDSLLHFYRIDHDASTFTLKHWTCSPSGVVTAPTAVYTYTNSPGAPTFRTSIPILLIQGTLGICISSLLLARGYTF
jgi:hypothetical protein